MRSQARNGTSWKRETTAEIRVCCRRDGLRIEKSIRSSENIGQEREDIELHGQAVLARRHQIGFHRSESAFVGLTVFVAELVPTGPPAGADHVQAGVVNLPEILIPHINIRVVEIEALHLARHVGCADNGQRMTVQFEVVAIDGEPRTRMEIGFVANPIAGMVDRAHAVVIDQFRLNDVETLAAGRGNSDRLVRMKRDCDGCAIATAPTQGTK